MDNVSRIGEHSARGLITGRQSGLTHPSNRLYRGECRGFLDAVDTYIAQMRYELPLFDDDDEISRKGREEFAAAIEVAGQLRQEYQAAVGQAERALFARWAESADARGNGLRAEFGKAGLDGDYSGLAV